MFERLYLRLRSLFRSRAVDAELDDEVRFHVEQQTAEFVRRGLLEQQAEILARRQFGNVTLHKEECRQTRKLAWLESIGQDVRQSLRTLRRSPGFTTVSILTLSLGIGAMSAMFSVMDRAVLHPVVAPDPDRLVWLQESSKAHNESGSNPSRLADWQQARSFQAVAGIYSEGLVWVGPSGPARLEVLRIFGDLFGVLHPDLLMGRPFTERERNSIGSPVALLTAKAFRERFESNVGILNRTIQLANKSYQVVGVLSPSLNFPEDIDVWTPAPTAFPSRGAGFLDVMARLAPNVSMRQAQAEINLLTSRFASQYPATDAGRSARAIALTAYIASVARKPLLVLFSAVICVLLIGCLNIAGLLLARGLARRREAAIRVSVGAGYGRLARLFFTERLLLAFGGCVGGLLLAFAGVPLLKTSLPPYVPNLGSISVNLHVVACGIGFSILAALLFGGLPA
jgi:predicted permease